MSEDIKQKAKYEELKKRYREAEDESELLQEKLNKAQKIVKRLQLERSILLERLDKNYDHKVNLNNNYQSDSDTSSEILDLVGDTPKPQYTSSIKKKSENIPVKAQKKKKDPNAPKGPGNVFFLYCRLERDKMKDKVPEENVGEINRLLGQKWKSLGKEEKQVYYDTYKKEMGEYEEAMKIYNSNNNNNTPNDSQATASSITNSDIKISSLVDKETTAEPVDEDETEEEEEEEDMTNELEDNNDDDEDEDDFDLYQQQQQYNNRALPMIFNPLITNNQ